MTAPTPDPLALAEEAERLARAATPGALTVERYDHGGGRMSVQDANRRHLVADTYHEGDRDLFAVARDSMLTLAAALRAAHEENRRLREALMPLAAVSMQAVDLGQDLKYSVLWRFTEDQVRAARKALAGGKEEG